jgi:cation:H+ antiporter
MTMITSIVQFLVSAGVIVAAGVVLTQFADTISHRTKLGSLLVGSILLAGATSLPELSIDISAIRLGAPDLAVGDLIGSSLFNLLILATLDLTRYSRGRMLSEASAASALSAGASIVLTVIAAVFLFLGPRFESVTLAGAGPGSIVLLVAYLFCVRLIYVGQKVSRKSAPETEPISFLPGMGKLTLRGAIIGYLVAAAAIVAAAPFLAKAADDLAERTGLGGTFFGTTFVALCTSLPEVVTTLTAVRMKAFDLALGNIFGSNCFNMVLIVPLDLVHPGSLLASVSPTHVYTALCTILVTMVVILGQLYRVERKKPFLEPDALLAILLVVAALTGAYFLRE